MDGLIDTILNGLFDVIYNVMQLVLDSFIGRLLYYAETGLCKIVGMLDSMFKIFSGIDKVSYDGSQDYLINIFFNNRSITNVYWGMALIGIAMVFGFAIAAVVRKMFDAGGRMQTSMGQIITAALRSIFLILGMSAIMVIVLNSTNVLMQQINYIFNDPENLDLPETRVYNDEEFAAMGRVLNTIGNYSLNPSYSSRYNINTCFNEIRADLHYLQGQNVFRYYYATVDADGNTVNTWQSVLQKIANSHDLRSDLKLDVSYDAVTNAMVAAMDVLRNDASFRPLESYTRVMPAEGMLPLDRYLFLMGTMHAAKNNIYNEKAELTDPVRGPYYSGEKNIYDLTQVSGDFDVGFATDYLVVFISAIALIFDLITIILNCIARIFNMLFLYLIAPPIFATQPFDGGGKTRQWLTAFIVQAFSVFGTVIAMRLLLILLPIVTSSKLVLFQNAMLNTMSKLVLIYGLFEVAKKATGLLTGILADSAGWQSVQAGDMSGSAGKLIGGVAGAAKAVSGTALKVAGKTLDFATKPAQNVAKRGLNATVGKAARSWSTLGAGLEDQATAKAKERLAEEQAYAKLTGKTCGDSGGPSGGPSGGKPALPGGQSGAGGKPALPGKQSGGAEGGASAAPKTPPPLPDRQGGGQRPLSVKAQNLFGADANGKKLPKEAPASAGGRPTLGDKPADAPRAKEAPASSGRRMSLDSEPRQSAASQPARQAPGGDMPGKQSAPQQQNAPGQPGANAGGKAPSGGDMPNKQSAPQQQDAPGQPGANAGGKAPSGGDMPNKQSAPQQQDAPGRQSAPGPKAPPPPRDGGGLPGNQNGKA